MSLLTDSFASAQRWLFETFVQPAMYALGAAGHLEWAFDATEWMMIGAIEITVLWLLLGALERRFPAEPVHDRDAVRDDVLYTLLHRLGGFSILAFALLQPWIDELEGALRLIGLSRFQLDALWPGVTDVAWVSFAIYLVVFDLADYWLHRWQHTWRWWWALHALHHSQRQMTFWSDQRNHLLDDLIRDAAFALLGVAIGVPPGQFVLLVVASRVMQSLQHANLRLRFPGISERLLVSPSFHRRHHAVDYGHSGRTHGCNFAVLFPIWDMLFRTADFREGFVPTGISDQLEGRDYGRGFWSQQWRGLMRMLSRH